MKKFKDLLFTHFGISFLFLLRNYYDLINTEFNNIMYVRTVIIKIGLFSTMKYKEYYFTLYKSFFCLSRICYVILCMYTKISLIKKSLKMFRIICAICIYHSIIILIISHVKLKSLL